MATQGAVTYIVAMDYAVHSLLEWLLYLHNTYFSFQNKFYEQVEGATMGTPVSPIVANLYMEHFEGEALRSAFHPQVLVQVSG